jgi:hypothetical protein
MKQGEAVVAQDDRHRPAMVGEDVGAGIDAVESQFGARLRGERLALDGAGS